MPLHGKTEKGRPKVVRKLTLVYLGTIQEGPADNRHTQGYKEVKRNTIEILDLKKFKEAVISTLTLCERY